LLVLSHVLHLVHLDVDVGAHHLLLLVRLLLNLHVALVLSSFLLLEELVDQVKLLVVLFLRNLISLELVLDLLLQVLTVLLQI